jgi:RNA polymerase sigma-70 factor, ECF subfamily
VSGIQEGFVPPKEGAAGNEPAFTVVYQREFSYVWHSLRRLGVRPEDLADVTHDVFMVLWRRFGDLDPTRQSRPWIFGMALRVATAYRRRAFRLRERLLGENHPEIVDPEPLSDARLAEIEQRQLVESAIGALDLDRRAVLIMHDFDGHGGTEIATTLGIPLKTMYSRLASARSRFVKAFRRAERRRQSS